MDDVSSHHPCRSEPSNPSPCTDPSISRHPITEALGRSASTAALKRASVAVRAKKANDGDSTRWPCGLIDDR